MFSIATMNISFEYTFYYENVFRGNTLTKFTVNTPTLAKNDYEGFHWIAIGQ